VFFATKLKNSELVREVIYVIPEKDALTEQCSIGPLTLRINGLIVAVQR